MLAVNGDGIKPDVRRQLDQLVARKWQSEHRGVSPFAIGFEYRVLNHVSPPRVFNRDVFRVNGISSALG